MTQTLPDLYPQATHRHLGRLMPVGALVPQGVTVHYTADRDLDRTITALAARGLGYHLVIDRDGAAHQVVPFNGSVWHAGKAVWGSVSPNRGHVSVALLSWGELEELAPGAYQTWNGKVIPTADVAVRRGAPWDAATAAQEAALVRFLTWAVKAGGLDPASICGHDECAIPHGRKVDPGGTLPWTMEELRALVAAQASQSPAS